MSPEAQRIAIAESCGWFNVASHPYEAWEHPTLASHNTPSGRPDYLNDLNAMHEAEDWLLTNKPDLRPAYRRILIDCSEKSHHYWRATAAQRAEAFLRALNLWQESQPPTP